MNWQKRCRRLIEIGIKCGDKPQPLADQKTVSLLFLSIGVEGRLILNCKKPHILNDTLSTAEFWKIVEDAFIRSRNITFDRHIFLITKQLRGETVEHFYGKQKEIAENCDFENKEVTLISDVFITNLIDPEIQKELLKQTVEPRQALELVINMELGMRNQHLIQQQNKILNPASVNAIQFPSNPRTANCSFENNFQKPNSRPRLWNHFARVCRKQKNTKPQNSKKRSVNTVDEEPHPEDSVNFLWTTKLDKSNSSSGEDNTVALIENDIAKIEPLNMLIKIVYISTTLLVDSGSACIILNRSLATQVVKKVHLLSGFMRRSVPQLRTFSNEPIHIEGKV